MLSERNAGAGMIGLDIDRLDLSVLNNDRVPPAPQPAKNGLIDKPHIHRLGEFALWVRKESNLLFLIIISVRHFEHFYRLLMSVYAEETYTKIRRGVQICSPGLHDKDIVD